MQNFRFQFDIESNSEAFGIWTLYAEEFKRRWGVYKAVAQLIGGGAKALMNAEYIERGESIYRDSPLIPIRNAYYSAVNVPRRWPQIAKRLKPGTILDYGCGVGFTCHWAARRRFEAFGYELEGIQTQIAKATGLTMLDEADLSGQRFDNVICCNVLEHVRHPKELLARLYELSDNVIANVCMDKEHSTEHIAPEDELRECAEILAGKGNLYLEAA